MMSLISGSVLVLISVSLLAILVHVYSESGPDCPGADPAWLGWCEDAPAR